MEKMSLAQFRELKSEMLKLLALQDEIDYRDPDAERYEREYLALQEKLLSFDLSDIPFEEWEGLVLFSEEDLDLSKTHANIDLGLLADISYETINLNGCHVRNLSVIDYDESTFDEEFMRAHSEYFPDESIPVDIRKKFYDKKLTFSDLAEYPALRKYFTANSAGGYRYASPSAALIVAIGFENAMKLFDEYPEFVCAITTARDNDSFSSRGFHFASDVELEEGSSYEVAKQYIFKQIIAETKHMSNKFQELLSIFPQEMIEQFPNVFIQEGELPEDVKAQYYEGRLRSRTIRHYKDVFKTKDLELGTRLSSEIRGINQVFGDVWKFIEAVPDKYADIVANYLSDKCYQDDVMERIKKKSIQELIAISLRYMLYRDRHYLNLEDLYSFTDFLSVDEIFAENPLMVSFMKRFGFKNIIEFGKAHNDILESKGKAYGDETLLDLLASAADTMSEEELSSTDGSLLGSLTKVIHKMREHDGYDYEYALSENGPALSELFPTEFMNYQLVDTVLKDLPEEEKKKIINTLEKGLNGNTVLLLEVLNEHPDLLPAVMQIDLVIKNQDPWVTKLYQKAGKKRFLNVLSQYGNAILYLFRSLDYSAQEQILADINDIDYSYTIDQCLCNLLCTGERYFDIRTLPPSFKEAHPEFYLDENAPEELKKAFYGQPYFGGRLRLISTKDISEHPEWIPFLQTVFLEFCMEQETIPVSSSRQSQYGYSFPKQTNFYEAMALKFSKKETLDFVSRYGRFLHGSPISIDRSLSKEEQYDQLLESIRTGIINRKVTYSRNMMPEEFIERYPDLFIDENAPEILQTMFYQQKITPEMIQTNPEWKPFLMDKDMSIFCWPSVKAFTKKIQELGLDNNRLFELYETYGEYIAGCGIKLDSLTTEDVGNLDSIIQQQMVESITVKRSPYDESAKPLIGDEHPELFLADDAPEELKEVFYNHTTNTPLTFELLRQHKEWLPYLQGKNVLLSLKKCNFGMQGLDKLFEKYGFDEALKIGMKNPESVMKMLSLNKFDILSTWYDRLQFVPHHIVMSEFPIDQIDKFAASGKKWSQLMRIERYNINDDAKSALLKASMCFGVFDNDMEGFNQTIQLFTSIPKTLSAQDMQRIIKYLQDQMDSSKISFDLDSEGEVDNALYDDSFKKLALIEHCYEKNPDGSYSLRLDKQQNKDIVRILRNLMEDAKVSTILTPDKAHKLFDSFEMRYDPDFRDFLLKNIDAILVSDEYISYVGSMQRQWPAIKALNSNRVLTLDLALAFVKSNSFEGVQTGNEGLAEVSNMAGYDQMAFDRLQQIYNYGKSRTFSSIPRIQKDGEEYSYEMLRLDDPFALAIGTLTECCQRINGAAESSMEHSVVNKHGRVFVIKDDEGNIVAQSWVWRNKNVLCFDNIEIPEKAFTRAKRDGLTREKFTNLIFNLYKEAAEELMKKDEETFKKILDEGKITEEQFQALKLAKITIGEGNNDIEDALKRNAPRDQSPQVSKPLPYHSSIRNSDYLYISDSSTQYVVAGDQDVPISELDTLTLYSDEFMIHDNSNTKPRDSLILQKLEFATKGDYYTGRTQSDAENDIVSDIAYNYNMNTETTRIIMNANFAIIYEVRDDKIIIGDLLYNTSYTNGDETVDISPQVTIQIRMALEQIGEKDKTYDTSRLNQKQMEMFDKAMSLDAEIDIERGLSHEAR